MKSNTCLDLQKVNAKQMASMFQKQILNFYNPTRGLLFDLFLALTGLTGHKTHTSKKLTYPHYNIYLQPHFDA